MHKWQKIQLFTALSFNLQTLQQLSKQFYIDVIKINKPENNHKINTNKHNYLEDQEQAFINYVLQTQIKNI